MTHRNKNVNIYKVDLHKGGVLMQLFFSDMKDTLPNGGIFLAGPTKRNSKYESSWRRLAVSIFEASKYKGILYIPEYGSDTLFDDSTLSVNKQTDWEWEALDKASVIMFWIPRELPDMPAFTTNVEFGRYTALAPQKIILGYPKEAAKMRYLDYLYTKSCNRYAVHSLEETICEALNLYKTNNPFVTPDLENYNYTDADFLAFIETDDCKLCGTQRCMADLDTLNETGPCMAFKHYLENKKNTSQVNITHCF